tara:strand:+ start:673 stop:2091 length:1419 start_codon:yes stop_codon:yes gene_type:complete
MTEQHPNQITLLKFVMSKSDGSNPVKLDTDMIISFDFMESIVSPMLSGQVVISDSKDFINEFPIEGGEIIEIDVKSSWSEDPTQYKLRVYKIGGRVIDGKKQLYTLLLISEEALVNESVRVQKQLEGNPESIIGKLIQNELKSTKEIFSEPSRFKIKMLPGNVRPFDIIAKLTKRSVSNKTTFGQPITNGDKEESQQQIKGSAGFLFWETNRGYNFFSVDALCDISEERVFSAPRLQTQSWGPYKEEIANIDDGSDARLKLAAFTFSSEVDIMSSLRLGKYSTKMVFFNHSTGKYDEYLYKIKDSYDNMAHLGGQTSVSLIPVNTEELSVKPTRIMSAILDHETWFDDPKIGNPDDPKADNPTEYADWIKYYSAQSVARYDLLQNQEATMKIPVNPLICAGDKIAVALQRKAPDFAKEQKPFDTESSGVYLVKEVTHTYSFVVGGVTGNGYTTLRLFRDSYGTEIEPSKHGE